MADYEDEWVPDDALSALTSEAQLHPEEKPEDTARRLLRENLPTAILGIIHTSQHGSTDRMRFEAQKYITERVLGRIGDDAFEGDKSPVESFIDDVTEFVAQSGT